MKHYQAFDYKDFLKWLPCFIEQSSDLLTKSVIQIVQNSIGAYGVSGEIFSLYDSVIFETLKIPNGTKILVERFRNQYSSIRLYHGTRLDSMASIFQHGLTPGVPEKLETRAKEMFGKDQFLGVSDEMLELVFKKLRPHLSRQADRVFTSVDLRNFERCGHYLIYGSEFLQWVAAELQANDGFINESYHKKLRSKGVPTIVVIDYPIDDLPDRYSDFWDRVIDNVLWMLAENRKNLWCLDYTITLKSIDPKYIVDHIHPSEVVDPLFGNLVRPTLVSNCESCEKHRSME